MKMNDRLKFRIWDNINNVWIEGPLLDIRQGCIAGYYMPEEAMKRRIITEQCTGLKDKNGKLIYEGDICIPAKDMADKAGEVYRAESGAYFIKGRMKSGMEYDFGIYWHHNMYEIIGNIHENADLLRQRDD